MHCKCHNALLNIAVRAALSHWLTHTPLPCVQPCHIGSLTHHCRACSLVTLAHSHTIAVHAALSHWLTHTPMPCVQPCHIGSLTYPCRACSLVTLAHSHTLAVRAACTTTQNKARLLKEATDTTTTTTPVSSSSECTIYVAVRAQLAVQQQQ